MARKLGHALTALALVASAGCSVSISSHPTVTAVPDKGEPKDLRRVECFLLTGTQDGEEVDLGRYRQWRAGRFTFRND